MNIFNFEAFFISLGLIFLAELGDKTQIMVITLAAQKNKPFKIGLSASLGISAVAIIGIIIGYIFSITIPTFWIKIAAIIIFLIFGIYTIIRFNKIEDPTTISDGNGKNENIEESSVKSRFNIKNTFVLAFTSVFLMEFGDKTQLMTITLTANYLSPIEVGLGAILALSSLCFLGAYLGGFISEKISRKWINLSAGIFFILMGLILILELIFNIQLF